MNVTIDCGTCTRQNSSSCDGCVVNFLIANDEADTAGVNDAVIIDLASYAAVKRLQAAGMVPNLLYSAGV